MTSGQNNNDFNTLIMQQLSHISNQITLQTSEFSKQTNELNNEIQYLKKEMAALNAKFEAKDNTIMSLENWKNDVSQILSLSDISELKKMKSDIPQTLISIQKEIHQHTIDISKFNNDHSHDISNHNQKFQKLEEEIRDLQDFKTKSFTAFAVLQIIMTLALFWKEIFFK